MSFILNALRKSELQRQHSQSEPLENKILQNGSTASKNNTSIWIVLLVVFNLMLLAYFVWSFTEEKQGSENTVYQEQAISQVNNTPNLVESVKPLKQEIVLKEPQPSIAEQIKQIKQKTHREVIASNTASTINRHQVKQQKNTDEFEKKLERNSKIKPLVIAEKLTEEKVPTVEQSPKHVEVEAIPFLSEMDQYFRRSVPDLNINVFVYSEDKADRFIMVEMRKFKAGEQLLDGMTLKEIRIASIVVDYNNKTFQIKRK